MKLALLICHLPERKSLLDRLTKELISQLNQLDLAGGVIVGGDISCCDDVGIFINEDNHTKTTGQKRNELIQMAVNAGAHAIAFIDDDDMVGLTYIQRGMEFIASGTDAAELWGQIYWSGKPGKPFHHFLECGEWWEDDNRYYRTINHLNFVKLELVKDIPFPEQSFGEDGKWSMTVKEAGVLKTMFPISETIYNYFCGEPKHAL